MIISEKLHEFSNTTFYSKYIKEPSCLTFFILNSIVTAKCMFVLFHNSTHFTFLHVLTLLLGLLDMNSALALKLS